jgi:hypothetical protein
MFLCRFGIHKWGKWYAGRLFYRRKCERCDKVKESVFGANPFNDA